MENDLRILMLNYEFPPIGGGAGKAHLCLLKEFANIKGLTVDVLTSSVEPGISIEDFSENITIYKVGIKKKNLHYWRKIEVLKWLFKASKHYAKLIDNNHYDLAHAFFGFPTAWLCLKQASKLPYIISLRGSDVPGYNVRLGLDYKILAGLFRRIWNDASAVIANSKGLQNLALKFTPNLEIGVIPNGINTEKFTPADNKISCPIKMLTVCRLITRKRIDLLIEAVAEGKKTGVDMELNIAGDGNIQTKLESLAQELGIADRVNFFGRIDPDKMPDMYKENHIFVMSSAHEGMSNAMLEAMASGLPIVTTLCEGVDELICDNGIVVDKPEPNALAQAVIQIAGDDKVYQKMCQASVKHAANFTWTASAEQYLKLYERVLMTMESCDGI